MVLPVCRHMTCEVLTREETVICVHCRNIYKNKAVNRLPKYEDVFLLPCFLRKLHHFDERKVKREQRCSLKSIYRKETKLQREKQWELYCLDCWGNQVVNWNQKSWVPIAEFKPFLKLFVLLYAKGFAWAEFSLCSPGKTKSQSQLAMPRSAVNVVHTMRTGLWGSSECDFYRCISVLPCDTRSSSEMLERLL